jgi:hypothetical protein
MVMTISARPADVPLGRPACTGYADVRLKVPASIAGLVSACVNRAIYAPYVIVIYNLSDDVLSIRSANSNQPALRPYLPASANLLPSGTGIEIYTQNASVRQLSEPTGTMLLPVGGRVVATQDRPIRLAVQVNKRASAASYAAQLMTGYVVDNLTRQIPRSSALAYEASVASCVRLAHALWPRLYQQPAAEMAATLQTALAAVPACQDLQKKMTSDHAEELSAAAAAGRLTGQALAGDLAMVANEAGQAAWESHLNGLAQVPVTVADGH